MEADVTVNYYEDSGETMIIGFAPVGLQRFTVN